MMRHAIRYNSTKLTPLTFEEICPAWSDKLNKDLSNDDIQILVRKPELARQWLEKYNNVPSIALIGQVDYHYQ
jgi:hypothetical protein